MYNPPLTAIATGLRMMRRPLALASLLAPGVLLATPTGGVVVAGQASIGTPSGNGLHITQGSQSAVINWQDFSIGADEYVIFHQPSSSATVLNRVVGGLPSEILGNLSANGRVFLVNPAGVVFGKGAQVDVGGLLASTLDLDDADFMNGRYLLRRPAGSAPAGVSNAGTLTAAPGGFVVLAGEQVSNSGLIQAQLGSVALASGAAVTLGLDAQGLVNFSIDAAALSANAGVENVGDIIANGGRVLLDAQVAQGLVSTAVNNRGRLQAQSIEERNGEIHLGARGGDVVQDGLVDASGADGRNGGSVRIHSDQDIRLGESAEIRFGGAKGGDSRLVAGGTLSLAEGSVIDGRAAAGGRGGFLEISAHVGLRADGELLLGPGGRLLIDPAHLEVAADCTNSTAGACFTSGAIAGQLNSGTDVALIASDRISFASGSSISAYGGASLLLGIGSPETGSYGGEFPNSPGVFGFIRGNASEGNGDILMGANSISTGGSFRAFGGLDTGDVQLGNISAADIEIESAGSISTGALNATEAVHATAKGGGISTGNIRVDGSGFGATIELSARDGISTGDLTAIHRHDGSGDTLSARISVRGNDHYGTPGSGNVSTGAITLQTVTNGVAGVSSNGSLELSNDGQYVSDGYGGRYVGGGNVSSGLITSDIQATAPPAECLPECSTYSYNDIFVSGAGDLQIGGVRTTGNAGSDVQEHFLSLHSGNAGTVRTGDLNLGHLTNVYLSSASAQDSSGGSGGSGDVIVGLVNGSVGELDIHAAGAVTLTPQALVAEDIGIASGRGNLVTENLTATAGGIRLSAEGGSISTGALSATATANPFPQESAQPSAFYGGAGVYAEARDGISTGDISVVGIATADDQFLSGQVMLRGTAFADPAAAGGTLTTGKISIRTEPGTHQGVSGSAYVHLSNHAQTIEDASGVRSVGGGSISTGDIQLTVPATAAGASCVDCVSSADAEVYLNAERDINVGAVLMRATAPDTTAASNTVLMSSEDGGNITTGVIDVGSGGDVSLGSHMRAEVPGTGTILLDGIAGNAGHVDVFSAGGVRILQDVTANSISLQAENGHIDTEGLTATDGSLFLAAAGRVATGALSATGRQFSEVRVHARDSITTGAVSVTARATDHNQTLDADVVMTLNAGETGATGGDIGTGNIRVQTDTAGFTGIDASTSVSLSNHAFSSSPTPAATVVKAIAGGIRTGDILLETHGDQSADADVHLFAGRDINTGAIRFSGAAGTRFLDVATQSGGDIALGRLDLMPGTTTHLSAFSDAGATDLGHIRLGPISDGGLIDAFATGQLLIDNGTTALRLGNVQFNADNIVLRGGSMDLSGTLNAGAVLDIRSPGVVTSATGLAIHAGGVAIEAQEIRLSKANFRIGSHSVELGTDAALLEKLDPARRPQTTGPNAAFQARSGNGVTIGDLDVEGGYIFVRAPGFFSGKIGRGGSSSGAVSKVLSPMLFNLRPGAASDGMDVSRFQASLTQFTVPLDGSVTFAFGGSGQTGDIIASQPIDFGGSSVALQTSGKVAADLIRSTGQVIVIGGTPPPPPVDHETQTETQNVLAATTNTSTYASKQDSGDADDERQGSGDEAISFEMAASSVVDETSGAPGEDLQCK